MSRVTRYDHIAFFLTPSQAYYDPAPSVTKAVVMCGQPFLANIVYPEAIEEIKALAEAYERERSQAEQIRGGLH
jgi:hypothetical protein